MFSALFISASSGVSSKTNKNYYRVELIAQTITKGKKVTSFFLDKNIYEQLKSLSVEPMQILYFSVGVNDAGRLEISDVSVEKK